MRRAPHAPHAAPGFTLVELLIVIAVVILLLSILTVAIAAATKTSQNANTRSLMNAVKQGLVRFKDDVGYYPPVLGPADPADDAATPDEMRALKHPPDPLDQSTYQGEIQLWYSETTIPDYLLGYGDHQQDGYGVTATGGFPEEQPLVGIRHPGPDGVWGATLGNGDGFLGSRMQSSTNPNIDTGRVFGPYFEVKDERLLGSTDGTLDRTGRLNVYLPGEGSYDPEHPKVLLDYWGRPIRFYRQVYPPGTLSMAYRSYDQTVRNPTLSDVFLLRPARLATGEGTDSHIADDNGDTTTVHALQTAEIAIFSSGPDRRFNRLVRYDAEELNVDNIVELGP